MIEPIRRCYPYPDSVNYWVFPIIVLHFSRRDESYNRHLMDLIDEQFTRTSPFYGVSK
jgi:hypothetical protein